MKTRAVLIRFDMDYYPSVIGVFKDEKAAWAHVDFIGEQRHSEIHNYEVEEVESFE